MPPKDSSAQTRGLGRNGSRASTACISCRQRKIKCDVQNKAPGMRCSKCQASKISCELEPGGDRRRCRGENTSESLSVLRGRMEALEEMLLRERRLNRPEHRDSEPTSNDHLEDQEQQSHANAAQVPGTDEISVDLADVDAPPLTMDAAATMLDLHRTDTTSMSTSDSRPLYETQNTSYDFDPMPLDNIMRLETPRSPGRSNRGIGANIDDHGNDQNVITHHDRARANTDSEISRPHGMFGTDPCGRGDLGVSVQTAPSSAVTNARMAHIGMDLRLDDHNLYHQQSGGTQRHEQSTQATNQSSHIPAVTAITPSNEDVESATETEDGRFYGPTSQPYLRSTHEESPLSITDDLEVDMSLDIDSLQVRRLLLENYWAIHSLSAKVIVDKGRFLSDRAIGKRSQYYSTFLENSLLACATRTSTSSSMRELGNRFLDRARAEVMHELEHLNVASMQGFLLLSDYEATRGRDRLGWMYSGMACRSLYDLGLHENAKEKRISPVDIICRHSVFLTTFVYDQLWSLYLGRPSSISLGYVRTARLAAKDVTVSEELDAWVSLAVQIARVTETLNSSSWLDARAFDRKLSELATELDASFDNLPTRLRYEEGNAFDLDASAYGLNIQHNGLRMVLHRNIIRLWQERRRELEAPPHSGGTDDEISRRQYHSGSIVHQSAIRVAKLIRTYKQMYGVEKIVTIMLDNMYVASTALISRLLSDANRSCHDKDFQWLRFLSNTLDEVQKYYPIATVMMSTLSRRVEKTSLSTIFGSRRFSSSDSRDSASRGIEVDPLLSEAGWGSREAFVNSFSFDMGPILNPSFNIEEDHIQYFQNPGIDVSPHWNMSLPH